MTRSNWKDIKANRAANPERAAGYDEARRAIELGEMIRARREELDMTQAELAERVGTRQPAIARLEAGGTQPTIDLLDRIAAAFGTSLTVRLEGPAKAS